MELHGVHGISDNFDRIPWPMGFMGSHRNPWYAMKLHQNSMKIASISMEFSWKARKFQGFQWDSSEPLCNLMGFHGRPHKFCKIPTNPMGFLAITGDSKESHEIPWNPMRSHAFPRDPIQSHGIPWKRM